MTIDSDGDWQYPVSDWFFLENGRSKDGTDPDLIAEWAETPEDVEWSEWMTYEAAFAYLGQKHLNAPYRLHRDELSSLYSVPVFRKAAKREVRAVDIFDANTGRLIGTGALEYVDGVPDCSTIKMEVL